MVGIRVISKSPIGQKALQQHLKEVGGRKRGIQERVIGRMLFSHEVTCEDPLTIEIVCKAPNFGRMLVPENFRRSAIDALTQNGASINIDYTLEDL